jgi:hypothetical protein
MANADKVFKFYADPGHGWLAVKIKDAASVGLNPTSFSPYSYIRGQTLYLEEDCDAPLFADAWRAAGRKFNYVSKHTNNNHPIRSYDRVK